MPAQQPFKTGNLLSLSDAYRRKSVRLDEVLESLARETTGFVGNLSQYYTEYAMNEGVNRQVTQSLIGRVSQLRALARASDWDWIVLPLEPVPANTHYVWVRDAVLPRLDPGLRVMFQRGAYLGPPIAPEDERRNVKTVFSNGYRGLVHLSERYGPTHPRRREYLPHAS